MTSCYAREHDNEHWTKIVKSASAGESSMGFGCDSWQLNKGEHYWSMQGLYETSGDKWRKQQRRGAGSFSSGGGALWEAADKVFSIAIFLEQLAFVCCFFLFDYFNVLV